MEGSVGTALRNARLSKKITVDEAARATKMRPDRIADLEKDDYTNFAGLAYARSFLILYAKFLEVDISKFHTMEVGNSAGVGDYQYLQNEKGVNTLRFARQVAKAKPRWVLTFVIFTVMVCFGAIVGYWVMNVSRLGLWKSGGVDQIVKAHQSDDHAALANASPSAAPSPVPAPSPAPVSRPAETGETGALSELPPQAEASPGPSVSLSKGSLPPAGLFQSGVPGAVAEPLASGTASPPVPAPAAVGAVEPEVRRAEPITPSAETPTVLEPPVPAASAPKEPLREVTIRVTKKTKVRIVRDESGSQPVYNDWLTPGMPPLTFRGRHFWIKAGNRQAVKVSVSREAGADSEAPVEFE